MCWVLSCVGKGATVSSSAWGMEPASAKWLGAMAFGVEAGLGVPGSSFLITAVFSMESGTRSSAARKDEGGGVESLWREEGVKSLSGRLNLPFN